MDIQFVLGVGVGVFIGSGYRFLYDFARDKVHWGINSARPLRAVDTRQETRVFAASVSASIEPEHIPLMWKSRMRAFVFHCEACEPNYSLANARELKRRIGLDRPRQMEYLNLLIEAGLIRVKQRETSVWLTDWTTRHKAIASLPYPRNIEPPDFITRKAITDATDNTQNRHNTRRIQRIRQ